MNVRELDSYSRLSLPVVAATGCELVLEDGRRLLDLYGGHCVNTLGAGDAGLGRVLVDQWRELSFVTNMLDHRARREFLHAFDRLLPKDPESDGPWSVFCSNSGAEANESALKVAIETSGRTKVVCFGGAFHGRTAAAHAISDARQVYPAAPFDIVRVPFGDTAAATQAIDDATACVILEPIQSLAGVTTATPEFLGALRAACRATGSLLIFDEVQTASGRTGEPFAAQTFGVLPDIITTAKGAGGGFPLGLTVVCERVAQRVARGLLGSTFGGGPLALAAAAEIARRVAESGFLENVRATSNALREAALSGPVVEVRGAGLLLGLVLAEGLNAVDVRDRLLEGGVLVGTSNDPRVLRLMPPLVLRPAEADKLAEAFSGLEVPA